MIVYFVHELNRNPARKLLAQSGGALPNLRLVTYQQAFRQLSFPAGTLIFSDFEFLDGFGMAAAAAIADAALKARPQTRILNHPCHAAERFELLRRLHRAGMNPVEVTRLDSGDMPTRYPLFLRHEDGCHGAETGLIQTEAEFVAALAAGRPRKRRIAVSFEAAPDADGLFRKYGAFRIGDAIIPQHILRSGDWVVKSTTGETSAAFAAEELAFVRDNPHRKALLRATDLGGLQFGRIDYGLRDGQPVIFEVNPNPTFPNFRKTGGERGARRGVILAQVVAAMAQIDDPDAGRARLRFVPPPETDRYIQMARWNGLSRRLWEVRAMLARRGARRPPA
jgi:hypothetical protein